jgi:hypothetical protein
MDDLSRYCRLNSRCPDYGKWGAGNLTVTSRYEPGKRGRPKDPYKVPPKGLTSAVVEKTREQGRVVEIATRVVFGTMATMRDRGLCEKFLEAGCWVVDRREWPCIKDSTCDGSRLAIVLRFHGFPAWRRPW